jgi:portal protein
MPRTKQETEEFIRTAMARFRQAEEAEASIRSEALKDLKFLAGDQWPDDIRAQRQQDRRPCLTINRLPQFKNQVVNDIRQNKPAPAVGPVDDRGDVETAKVFQGLIRHVNRQSKADSVRAYAANYAVSIGRGFYRIITERVSDDPFDRDQEIFLKRIKNQFTVYFDPAAQEPDYSDAQWAFIVEDLMHEEHKRQFPNSELASLTAMTGIGNTAPGWLSKESVRIAEYFYIERVKRIRAKIQDGPSVWLDEIPTDAKVIIEATLDAEVPRVKWCKINAAEVLDERDWPGRWIPIVPVLGEELDIDGKTVLCGMIRGAKGPQQQYNFMASAETEAIALAPRAPFVAAEGQLENHEAEWKSANTRNAAVLQYKPTSVAGHAVPPPQRQAFEPAIQAISMARAQAADDLKATTGIYDPSLGARSNETSGRAILARQKEGDVANFHYIDNLNTAITHEARILVDLIPKIYDRPGRVARIIGEDDTEKQVVLNQPFDDGGIERIYDLQAGRYDVAVTVGPSYSTKRQEASESMQALAKAYPPLMQFAGDHMVKNMDWPGSQEIAERLKRMLPPELQDDDKNKAIPPKVQAQLQQSGQLIERLTQEVQVLSEEIRTKKFELESKERIEFERLQIEREKIQKDLAVAQAQLGSQEAIVQLQAELKVVQHRLEIEQREMESERANEQANLKLQADREKATAPVAN